MAKKHSDVAEKRTGKTEVLHMRLDPLTKFASDLLARIDSKKKVAIVEQLIRDEADRVVVKRLGVQWTALYDPHEGITTLGLLACPGYKGTPEELELRAFTVAHKEFWYADEKATVPARAFVSVLWNRLPEYQKLWREKRHENYWVAAEAMAADLKKAKLQPPKYGHGK